MKKYRIHFFYLVIISALAVVSRLKTNQLNQEIMDNKQKLIEERTKLDSIALILFNHLKSEE